MKLVYGGINKNLNDDVLYLNENYLQLPIGLETYNEPIKFLNNLEQTSIFNKKINELFSIDNFSLWWFIYPFIFSPIQTCTNFILKFAEILEKNNITEIELVGEFEKINLIKNFCKKFNISFQVSKKNLLERQFKNFIISKAQKYRYKKISTNKIKQRLNIFNKKSDKLYNFNDNVIFAISTHYRSQIYDIKQKQSIDGEYIQGKLISIIHSLGYETSGIDIDYTFRGQPEILNQRLEDDLPWVPLEYFVTDEITKEQNNFLTEYSKILKTHEFQNLFQINDISFWDEIQFDFEKLSFYPCIPYYFKTINSLKKFFQNNKPKTFFIPYETGPLALAILIACEQNHIKTFGIQHGLIYKNNSDYAHNNFKSKENPYGFPLPDSLLLFGNFTYDLLRSYNYPKEKLCVIGNLEFLDIDKIYSHLEMKDIKLKYKISKTKKIILFATSKIQSYYKGVGGNHDERVLTELLEKFSNDDGFLIIIKPHPSENIDYYERMILKYNAYNFKIIQGNLFELLFVSDIVISIFSTVLVDSIALRRPTIRVKFEGSSALIPYESYNVLIESTLDSLKNNILEIFTNDQLVENLTKNRIEFLKHQYNIPNQSITSQIKSLLDTI